MTLHEITYPGCAETIAEYILEQKVNEQFFKFTSEKFNIRKKHLTTLHLGILDSLELWESADNRKVRQVGHYLELRK